SRGLLRILNRDLRLAGIPKVDERGRTLDVHALRTTFGTLLSKGGVPPRTAQAAMRHSDIGLTMNVYTDPKLFDVKGARDALPALPLSGELANTAEVAKATGTHGKTASEFAPGFAPTADESCQIGAIAVKMAACGESGPDQLSTAVSPASDKRNNPL